MSSRFTGAVGGTAIGIGVGDIGAATVGAAIGAQASTSASAAGIGIGTMTAIAGAAGAAVIETEVQRKRRFPIPPLSSVTGNRSLRLRRTGVLASTDPAFPRHAISRILAFVRTASAGTQSCGDLAASSFRARRSPFLLSRRLPRTRHKPFAGERQAIDRLRSARLYAARTRRGAPRNRKAQPSCRLIKPARSRPRRRSRSPGAFACQATNRCRTGR